MKLFNFLGEKPKKRKYKKRTKSKGFGREVSAQSYTVEQKVKILQEYESAQGTIPLAQFCKWWGIAADSLKKWQQRYKSEGVNGLEPRPKCRNKQQTPEAIKEKIIELKQKDPQAGAQRIADHLARHLFYKITAETVRQILKSDERTVELISPGLSPKSVNKPPASRRFERSRPRQLYQMDIMTWMLKGLYRVYLIGCLDDNSRFIVSWGLFRRQTGAHVIDVLRAALERYDHPEEVLTDNGRQFYVWRGKNEFQKYLQKTGIKHIRSRPYHPQTLGKIESFWRNIYQELLGRATINSFEEAELKMRQWINYYNFKRPHQGISGLVPADRFFGVEKPMREAMLEGAGMVKDSLVLDPSVVKEPMYLIGRIGGKELRIIAKEGSVVVEGLDGVEKKGCNNPADSVEYSKNQSDGGKPDADRTEQSESSGEAHRRGEAGDSSARLERPEESEPGDSGGRDKPQDILPVAEKSPEGDGELAEQPEAGPQNRGFEDRGISENRAGESETGPGKRTKEDEESVSAKEANRD